MICEMMELKIVDGFEIYPTKFSSNYDDFFFFFCEVILKNMGRRN